MYSRACQRVHEIDAIADLRISGEGSDARIFEVGNQVADGVGGDDGVCIDTDKYFFGHVFEAEIES